MSAKLLCGRFELSLERPVVMGILNVTPDSFSDGSRHFETDAAIAHGLKLAAEGADIIDIGAESTRPGATPVGLQEEIDRLLPVLEGLRDCGAALSVDTFKPEVMRGVLDAGADMINDIYGFRQPGALEAVAASYCGLCVMHMQGEPRTMQQAPCYADVVAEVRSFMLERIEALRTLGVHPQRVVLDPGFGFGKTAEHNYELLRRLQDLFFDDYPWLVALSRKSMIGHVTGREPDQRLGGSIAGALAGIVRGAAMVRVHDVAQTVDAIKVWQTVQNGVSG
ncbi:dihydropteroate synthase [Pusillimonas noertemannii]|uniref:Dihydropteroate synthase n=1 Tax=Pusillimonas noertemannii TaxID=305977 RepID=A0A2U1CKR4_9BURK|nr:dihydropteroate synthase [Pusillimonas noertemannii]NYT69142.1 dihydropteroate synthase [Pusillimonas noertemannii]PVY61609.1 dihydropteroate synthase [Pusillimonas noertemannii]TFL09555.1 dihydropteroate synthase [Pusillimonas noertemannii]